jgi:hypothetical protein
MPSLRASEPKLAALDLADQRRQQLASPRFASTSMMTS